MTPIRFLKDLIDDPDPVRVFPYGGFGNGSRMQSLARVMEEEGVDETFSGKGLKNILHSLRRFETDEHPDVHVGIIWNNIRREIVSDSEGYLYFEAEEGLPEIESSTCFHPLTYELPREEKEPFIVEGSFMQPGTSSEFGVISDIDDTILETGVISPLKWKLLVNSITRSSHHRTGFPQTHDFYYALQNGLSGKASNPFFYLSNSPWNIYYYLEAYLTRMEFPRGVIILRDIGKEHGIHIPYLTDSKEVRIEMILQMYPFLPFVLIGDAAEADARIYTDLAAKFPQQVRAILIRKVMSPKHNDRVRQLLRTLPQTPSLLFGNMDEAREFAGQNGLIS